MIRLSTPAETRTTLALAGQRRRLGLAMALGPAARRAAPDPCLLLLGLAGRTRRRRGDGRRGDEDRPEARAVSRRRTPSGGAGTPAGSASPYLRNALWDAGYAVDTLETATDWSRAPGLAAALVQTLDAGLEGENERVHAFAHLSHVYSLGDRRST